MGRPAKTLTPETGSVGSNPTLSAILLAFGAIFSHLWKRKRHCLFRGLIVPDPVENPIDRAWDAGALLRSCDETTTLTEAVSMFWPPHHHEHLPTILGD